MRMPLTFKRILRVTLIALYTTGVVCWIQQLLFTKDYGAGPEVPASRQLILASHSVVGLLFMVLFGYLFHAHIETSWRTRLRRKSGLAVTGYFLILILTVPLLFYVSNDIFRQNVALFHEVLGTFGVVLVFVHWPRPLRARR